jgi:RNA polymerase subunit RPABC4/transcription elongation factor Spt4
MKYCYQCGRLTSGEPMFCQFCGRSYDAKLCPRHHMSPRYAEVCSQCGSRELSTPQPKVSLWWKVLEFLLRIVFGIGLTYLSLSLLIALLKSPMAQAGLVGLGLLLLVLWALWIMLPEWFRTLIHRTLKRKERRHER